MRRRSRPISEFSGRLQNVSRDVANQAGRRATRLSASASDRFPDAYRWTKSAARQASDEGLRLVEDGYRIAGRRFETANKMASDRLRGNALPELILAAAAGYILSYLVHRNLRHARQSELGVKKMTEPPLRANENETPDDANANDVVN
jgi:hypothetical protein